MGTLIGHVIPGYGIAGIGLWHLISLLRAYLAAPEKYQSRTWYLAECLPGPLQYIELLIIASGAALHMASELFIFPKHHHPFDSDGTIGVSHLNNFEHASMSGFYCMYAVVSLLGELNILRLPWGMSHVFAAAALSQEALLFHFHSADHMGVEGQYHWLLVLPILLGVACVLLEVLFPRSVLLGIGRSISFLLQGVWMGHMGWALFIPAFIPKGCIRQTAKMHGAIECPDHVMDIRAKALANLQFNWYFAGVLLLTAVIYSYMVSRHERQYHSLPTTVKGQAYRSLESSDGEEEHSLVEHSLVETSRSQNSIGGGGSRASSQGHSPRGESSPPPGRLWNSRNGGMETDGFPKIHLQR